MFEIVLYEPEIPPNAGNIIRLCANTGCRVHLVHPLGFSMRDRELKRAHLDYAGTALVEQHSDWAACRTALSGRRIYAVTTRATRRYDTPGYAEGDIFVFGPETRGLPPEVLAEFAPDRKVRLPMRPGSRSLNLSNAVAIVTYEAWRQTGFTNGR